MLNDNPRKPARCSDRGNGVFVLPRPAATVRDLRWLDLPMVTLRYSSPPTACSTACGAEARQHGWRYTRIAAVALLCSLLLAFGSIVRTASAEIPSPSKYDVESVYLFDFAKFVRWPAAAANETLTFCVAGQKVYLDDLTRIVSGEHIDAHPLSVRSVERAENEAGCSVLFIDSSEQEQIEGLLTAAAGKSILTVSDAPGFLSRGGMIQFLLINDRVRFAVDLSPVAASGISLNSELLKVAVTVSGGGKS